MRVTDGHEKIAMTKTTKGTPGPTSPLRHPSFVVLQAAATPRANRKYGIERSTSVTREITVSTKPP